MSSYSQHQDQQQQQQQQFNNNNHHQEIEFPTTPPPSSSSSTATTPSTQQARNNNRSNNSTTGTNGNSTSSSSLSPQTQPHNINNDSRGGAGRNETTNDQEGRILFPDDDDDGDDGNELASYCIRRKFNSYLRNVSSSRPCSFSQVLNKAISKDFCFDFAVEFLKELGIQSSKDIFDLLISNIEYIILLIDDLAHGVALGFDYSTHQPLTCLILESNSSSSSSPAATTTNHQIELEAMWKFYEHLNSSLVIGELKEFCQQQQQQQKEYNVMKLGISRLEASINDCYRSISNFEMECCNARKIDARKINKNVSSGRRARSSADNRRVNLTSSNSTSNNNTITNIQNQNNNNYIHNHYNNNSNNNNNSNYWSTISHQQQQSFINNRCYNLGFANGSSGGIPIVQNTPPTFDNCNVFFYGNNSHPQQQQLQNSTFNNCNVVAYNKSHPYQQQRYQHHNNNNNYNSC